MKMLIVDDDKVTRELLSEVFVAEGYEIETEQSGESALELLGRTEFPLILSDIRMLEIDGLAVLSQVREKSPHSIVVLMTGFGTMEGAIEAIQKGAFDYISKPFDIEELKSVVARARAHWEVSQSGKKRLPRGQLAPKGLIGRSPKIVEVYKTLARATLSPSTVLIVGESGTGKELVARGIHEHSDRRSRSFVAVNCSALTDSLLESELFGHVRGAFTGAVQNKIGLFEEAAGGTLFLDEIGDISAALQVKLLRVLQEGEYKAVGSTETKHSDVRIIAATHVDLDAAVAEGRFREDLYYRLKVISIELPPLRDRLEDLPDLVSLFVARYGDLVDKPVSHVSNDAMTQLLRYPWPGNVRELEHAIERAVTMTRTTVLYPEDFPPEIFNHGAGNVLSAQSSSSLEEVERMHILRVLEDAGFNKSKAAQLLGIDRKTLHRKAQRYKIRLAEKS